MRYQHVFRGECFMEPAYGAPEYVRNLKKSFRERLHQDERVPEWCRKDFVDRLETMCGDAQEIFRLEENLMIRSRYPDLELQWRAHRTLEQTLLDPLQDGFEWCPEAGKYLLKFIRIWIHQHTLLSDIPLDRHLAEWMRANGAGAVPDEILPDEVPSADPELGVFLYKLRNF